MMKKVKNKRIVTYIAEDDYKILIEAVDSTGRSIADYLRYLVEDHIKELLEEEESENEEAHAEQEIHKLNMDIRK